MKDYVIYDGRANYDVDRACVMEVFEAQSDEQAKKYLKRDWEGHDCALMDTENNFISKET